MNNHKYWEMISQLQFISHYAVSMVKASNLCKCKNWFVMSMIEVLEVPVSKVKVILGLLLNSLRPSDAYMRQ